MNADGTHMRNLTHGVGERRSPSWSPDGRKLMFVRNTRGDYGAAGRIYTMNADGTHVVAVSSGAKEPVSASWSPDGRSMAFTGSINHPGLYIENLQTRRVRRISADVVGRLLWSPDGRAIAYTGSPGGA